MSVEPKTSITDLYPDRILIRGYRISELMKHLPFSDVAFLVIFGRLPTKSESVLMNAILIACVDHGLAPCALASRIIIGGAPEAFQGAIAGGILSLGDLHGGAIEKAAKMLQEGVERAKKEKRSLEEMGGAIVHDHRMEKKIIYGIGHPIHKPYDPRTVTLFEIAEKEGYKREHIKLMEAIEAAAKKEYGRTLPINVDGAVAALISDMGIDWRLGKGFFIISRVTGLVANTYEQMKRPIDLYKVKASDIEYDGPKERQLIEE